MRLQNTGLLIHDEERATQGFTLFSPLMQDKVCLLDMKGDVVHEWTVNGNAYGYAYLLPNGNLLASALAPDAKQEDREGMRYILELDWNGKTIWQCEAPGQHHDFVRLANGNTSFLGFERLSKKAAGRVRGGLKGTEIDGEYILGDYIREVTPRGEVDWEWRSEINMEIEKFPLHAFTSREEYSHANSIFDLNGSGYLISSRRSSYLFMIERETKHVTWSRHEEHWGGQHDAQILENGNLLFFANGFKTQGAGLPYSQVIEMNWKTGEEVWTYRGDPPWTFNSPHISGCQRLASGNTLICEGLWGRIFEITPKGEIVWEYISPYEGWISRGGGNGNWIFRALRYMPNSPQIGGRLSL